MSNPESIRDCYCERPCLDVTSGRGSVAIIFTTGDIHRRPYPFIYAGFKTLFL